MNCSAACLDLEQSLAHIHRQIEMLNIFIGFEQTNRYVISEYYLLSRYGCTRC